jgi:arylsulfatase A-like enzyme
MRLPLILSLLCVALTAADRPNFIVIMADDHARSDLGCYGNTEIQTPHIDALAAGGMLCTDWHSNGAVCTPTRAALITGRYQQRSGLEGVNRAKSHRDEGLQPEEITIAEIMREAGYATGLIGKWHLGYRAPMRPHDQGFDEFIGFLSGNVDYHSHIDFFDSFDWWHGDYPNTEEGYTTDLITKYSIDFIQRHKDQPFFLYVPHEAPHGPYQAREDEPCRFPPASGRENTNPPGRTTNEDGLRRYRGMMTALDDSVGAIVAAVEAAGISNNTIIIFTSDNGSGTPWPQFQPLRGGKGSVMEGGHRMAGLVSWPAVISPGRTSDETQVLFDLLPTFAALGNATIPADLHIDGIDLSDHWRNGTPIGERTLFWQADSGKWAARKGPWKLVHSESKPKKAKGKKAKDAAPAKITVRETLYHLGNDLGESTDVLADHPEIAEELRGLHAAWNTDVWTGSVNRTALRDRREIADKLVEWAAERDALWQQVEALGGAPAID